MKKVLITIGLIYITISLSAQYRPTEAPIWTIGTAKTLPKNELDLNLFYASQYGITNNIELQTKPLWYYKFPNAALKIQWWKKPARRNKNFFKKLGIIITTKHGAYYPTPLMNFIQDKKIRNIEFDTVEINRLIAIKNEIYISFLLRKNRECSESKRNILTLKLGNQQIIEKKGKPQYTITKNALTYRHTNILSNNNLWYIGIGLDGKLNYKIFYSIHLDFYTVNIPIDSWGIDNYGLIYWYMGQKKKFRTAIGYTLSYTSQPDIQPAIYPLIDFTYIIKIKRRNKRNELFEGGVLKKAYDDRDALH